MNILARGFEYTAGQEVLEVGRRLGPAELALAASVGCVAPVVQRRTRAALLTTGDEIVSADLTPGPGQIRNSNAPLLEALLRTHGVEFAVLDSAPDDRDRLGAEIRKGLEYDLLLLTGGVSAGGFDFVPAALADSGVERVFHKVAIKPGAPVWFGRRANGLVFGLPGNPISVLSCFELFVATALRARQGVANPLPPILNARLADDFRYPTKRETYHPARLSFSEVGPTVSPVPWFGSADVRGAASANALLICPVGPGVHAAGASMRVLPLSRGGWDWPCSGIA
jgi:molybdopterin molybdotransferase